jgi:hypothetical protein
MRSLWYVALTAASDHINDSSPLPDRPLLGLRELSYPGVTKLKDVKFSCQWGVQWITAVLRTFAHNYSSLQQISLAPNIILGGLVRADHTDPADLRRAIGETYYQGWLELDSLLARLGESHSIRLEARYHVPDWLGEKEAKICVGSLLPETTTRGLIDLIEYRDEQ